MDEVAYNTALTGLAYQAADAAALAEGFHVQGSIPQRANNPGDLELGDRGWGTLEGKTCYAKADPAAALDDHTDGWAALRREWMAILTGASHEIPVSFTFVALAKKWTGNDNPGAWCKIVTAKLDVDPLMTVADWIQSQVGDSAT